MQRRLVARDVALLLGTDEAGYGPNLGPLVVAGTAWRIDAPPDEAEGAIAGEFEQAERTVTGKTMTEQRGQPLLVRSQRDETVTEVTWRRD